MATPPAALQASPKRIYGRPRAYEYIDGVDFFQGFYVISGKVTWHYLCLEWHLAQYSFLLQVFLTTLLPPPELPVVRYAHPLSVCETLMPTVQLFEWL